MKETDVAGTRKKGRFVGLAHRERCMDMRSIYLTVHLGEGEGTASEKKPAPNASQHLMMINILMEAIEALTIRIGAVVRRK